MSAILAAVNITLTVLIDTTTTAGLVTIANTTTTIPESPMISFQKGYGRVHGYISCIVCVFGMLSNFLNVIVLTRRHMITPTNCILTALAIASFLTMLTYLVHATYFYIAKEPTWKANHSKGWMYFILVQNLFIITLHNMEIWFTVSLAVFRYIFVCHHVISNRFCSLQRAILTITIIVIATIIVCIPNYFLYKVVRLSDIFQTKNSDYWIVDSDFAQKHDLYQRTIFWLHGVIMKVVPSILLTILSSMIIQKMHHASKRRVRLLQQTRTSDNDVNREHNRTTWMLVSVVLFFVITEMPQGILAMISGLNDHFFENIYSNIGEVLDLFVLLASAVDFFLYCIISQQFRDTFKKLFVVN